MDVQTILVSVEQQPAVALAAVAALLLAARGFKSMGPGGRRERFAKMERKHQKRETNK